MLRLRGEGERAPRMRGEREVALRAYLASPAMAVLMLVATLYLGGRYGLGLRDPDGVIGSRMVLVFGLVGLFWALDVVPRGVRAARATGDSIATATRAVATERWSWRRVGLMLGLIAAFYVTYLCYRNVKSYLPLARPELVDADLLELEYDLFGQHPATILHDLLGTGISAHVLSVVYLLFLTFVPLSVAAALVWTNNLAGGLWWLAVISLNWVLGVASYYILPSMGPAFTAAYLFSDLPATGVTSLQEVLLEHRKEFLGSPVASGGLQSIAAFPSLHVSVVLSGALVAHLLRSPRPLRIGMWAFFGATCVATIYFGWHYVVDDVAGVVIALVAVWGGALMTGWRPEPEPDALQFAGAASR